MASQNDIGFKSFLASPAISAFKVVDVQSDGSITPVAGSGSRGIGVLQEDVVAAGYASVKLWSAPGTFMVQISGGAVTAGTAYGIITGGYVNAVNGTFAPAAVQALSTQVASDGLVTEFALLT